MIRPKGMLQRVSDDYEVRKFDINLLHEFREIMGHCQTSVEKLNG